MKRSYFSFLAITTLGFASIAQAEINPILGLFNTGVDGTGAYLASGASDGHYSLVAVPAGSGITNTQVAGSGAPIPPWATPSASQWIGPAGYPSLGGPGGTYDYQTTFTIGSPFSAADFDLLGTWLTDNEGVDILVNGNSSGYTVPDDGFGIPFTAPHQFHLSSGFVTGLNTIDFVVHNIPNDTSTTADNENGNNPTGLDVEFTYAGTATPEPGTFVLLLGGAALVIAGKRRSL